MDYTKNQASPRSTRQSKNFDSLSQVTSVFTQRDKRFKPLKLICDTDYIRPDENDCVQKPETNPKLKAVHADALKRFEQELTGRKKSRQEALQEIEKKIVQDQNDVEQEKLNFKKKQQQFRDGIL